MPEIEKCRAENSCTYGGRVREAVANGNALEVVDDLGILIVYAVRNGRDVFPGVRLKDNRRQFTRIKSSRMS